MELRVVFIAVFVSLTVKSAFGFINSDYQSSELPIVGKYRRSVPNNTTNGTPWQVCVNFLGRDTLIPQKCYCGGILISPKWILSGTHCFRSNDVSRSWRKSQFQFVVGMSAGSKRQMLKAKNIILHDGYTPSKNRCVPGDDDVALIELEQAVKTDPQHVRVLPLPTASANFDGMRCSIGDWDGTTGTDLSHETVSIPSDVGACQINNNAGPSTVLDGESGGAIVCGDDNKVAAGVVQFGSGCGGSGKFVPITGYLNWIGHNTGLFQVNNAGRRKKRMNSGTDCFNEDFSKLRRATNRFMDDCFNGEFEKVEFKQLQQEEKETINRFIQKFSSKPKSNIEVYNVGSLGNIINLIYYFGRGGKAKLSEITANNIIIRQEDNGFLITAANFYCFPYRINGNNLQVNTLTDGSYGSIYSKFTPTDIRNFNAYLQIRAFAGTEGYPEYNNVHLAHFTFANLFAESVRNWNALVIAISFVQSYQSTIMLYRDNKWPMVGGSWNNQATWGRDTENTPQTTKDLFQKAIEELYLQYEDEDGLKSRFTDTFCDLLDQLGETKPSCCGDN